MRTSVATPLRELRRAAQRSWNLYRLGRERDRVPRAIVHMVNLALRHVSTPEEQAWIQRIEQLRTEMSASTAPLAWMDYGAGHPESQRAPETMRAGVEVTQPLGDVCTIASKSPFWCSLLFRLVRSLRPTSCVEMGTAVGISAAYQAAALALNGQGTLATLEGGASLADIARGNLRRLGLGTVEVVVGRFEDTLGDVLERRRPVDYVFVDGHHDERATLAYFEQTLPFLAGTALLIFDDIAWSEGMKRAWRTIARDERVGLTVDLGAVGLCVLDGSRARQRHFRVPLS